MRHFFSPLSSLCSQLPDGEKDGEEEDASEVDVVVGGVACMNAVSHYYIAAKVDLSQPAMAYPYQR